MNNTYKIEWGRKMRTAFKAANGYSTAAHYRTGGQRQQILDRDNHCCLHCGITAQEHLLTWQRPITIDHIDKNRKNNKHSNLQTLCLRCHGAKDINRRLIVPVTPQHRVKIEELRANGTTYQAIADSIGLSIGAVWKWVQRWEKEKSCLANCK